MDRQSDTRERILGAAEQLFVERGYHATALQEVADRVGITKPALYHHFASKAEILRNLLEPMTVELEQVLADAAAHRSVSAVRATLMAGWVEIFLRYRGTLLALMRELAAMPSDSFARVVQVMASAVDVAAGVDAGAGERVAVAQAISAAIDPVALLPDLPDEVLREHLLAGVWRLLGQPGPERGGRRARGGRPRSMSASDAELARELHASGEYTAEEIAARLGVSRATVYRHLKSPAQM